MEGMELVDLVYNKYKEDSLIDELGIILSSSNEIEVILLNHKLGLSMNLLKPLYKYTLQQIYNEYNNIDNILNDNYILYDKITLCSLFIKGDFIPSFIIRKKLINIMKI